jgi:hypothetical protein
MFSIGKKYNFLFVLRRILSKRPAKLVIDKNESKILIADKTGDVYSLDFCGQSKPAEPKLLMGHVSMMTDMVR